MAAAGSEQSAFTRQNNPSCNKLQPHTIRMQNVYPVAFPRIYKTGGACGRWQRSELGASGFAQRWQTRDVRPAWDVPSLLPRFTNEYAATKINAANTWEKFRTISSSYFLRGFFLAFRVCVHRVRCAAARFPLRVFTSPFQRFLLGRSLIWAVGGNEEVSEGFP